MSIDGQTWKKSINFYLDSTCYSSPRIHRCGVNRSDVCPAAEPWPPLCPWAPTGTAGGTGTEEQGPYIQFLSRSCPVQEHLIGLTMKQVPRKSRIFRAAGCCWGWSSTWSVYDRRMVMWLLRTFVFGPTVLLLSSCFPQCWFTFKWGKKSFVFHFRKNANIIPS